MAARAPSLRVGQGWDIHRLVPGRPLLLGGVRIPHVRGLLGHSDGDAVLHAVADALLGAVAAGDIGQHFPDTDPRWRGADSAALLAEVVRIVAGRGGRVVNVDVSIFAEQPKLAPHMPAMCARLAAVLGIDEARVGLKARTTEGLGPIGEGEAIGAQAVVLVDVRPAKTRGRGGAATRGRKGARNAKQK